MKCLAYHCSGPSVAFLTEKKFLPNIIGSSAVACLPKLSRAVSVSQALDSQLAVKSIQGEFRERETGQAGQMVGGTSVKP